MNTAKEEFLTNDNLVFCNRYMYIIIPYKKYYVTTTVAKYKSRGKVRDFSCTFYINYTH